VGGASVFGRGAMAGLSSPTRPEQHYMSPSSTAKPAPVFIVTASNAETVPVSGSAR
jgi:hypothetical protein